MALADTTLLTELIGQEAVALLVRAAGGLSVYVPKSPPFSGPLGVLPPEAQKRLASYAGGDLLYIPKCDGALRAARDAEIRAAYDAGARVSEIARRWGLSERWVYEILGRPEVRQPELF
ncbi:hypothetical protein K1I42_02800 [Hydrogenophilus thermoluteolus]|nr:Mor transcription activator family protein [Hydrogenophilus thermoluteolus]MBW7656226.1 hypothetical protein [Hydrogenophilus thermoluteolus]